MIIGKWEFRSPIVKLVVVPIEEELAMAIIRSVSGVLYSDIVANDMCDEDCEVRAFIKGAKK
jgi:hypothetical protein